MDAIMRDRRDQLIRDISIRYGTKAYPGRDDRAEIVMAESDRERFVESVMSDPRGSAISRGYYLGLGGELEVRSAPGWSLDADRVARARRAARLRRFLHHPIRTR